MAESNRKAINREEMMNRTMQEILNLGDTKKFLKQEKINSKKHECIGAVVQVLGQYFDIKVSVLLFLSVAFSIKCNILLMVDVS